MGVVLDRRAEGGTWGTRLCRWPTVERTAHGTCGSRRRLRTTGALGVANEAVDCILPWLRMPIWKSWPTVHSSVHLASDPISGLDGNGTAGGSLAV
jgi:hypothetical protein